MEQILNIPDSVRQDTLEYRSRVEKYLKGQTSPVAFRAYRVPMGVYEQRTEGAFMVRIRIGAGLVLPRQLQRIAELSKSHGNGIVHITTRQDIQIHQVRIEETPDVLEGLLEVGLSSRGGGGNTVRNVSACCRSGVCPTEQFDVAPYAIATAEYLLQAASSFNLPRKYKIVFSGCSQDCAFASVADLGFFAHIKDGVKGFAVYAGGGLGPNPSVAVKIEDFIPAGGVFAVAEAIKRLFDKHGDRSNRSRARLRYVLARVGADQFVEMYRQEYEEVSRQGLPDPVQEIRDLAPLYAGRSAAGSETVADQIPHNCLPESTEGLYSVRLTLQLGDIPADDLAEVGRIAGRFGHGAVRTTQLQNLLITGVEGRHVGEVNRALTRLSIDVIGTAAPQVVACTGAATCKLGLCLSRGLADEISKTLEESKAAASSGERAIRISGCPNSCGHHYIGDIGFQGKARRINGRLMPCYDVLAGARIAEGSTRLAERLGTVPARRIPDLVAESLALGRPDTEQLKSLVERYGDLSTKEPPEDYYFDYGSDQPFSLAGRGPGECGAGVMDIMRVDIDQAEAASRAASAAGPGRQQSEHLYKAILAAARSLLVIFGLEPANDREVFTLFARHLIEPGWVDPGAQKLLDSAVDWRMGDEAALRESASQTEELVKRIKALFLSLDAGLKFTIDPISIHTIDARATDTGHTVDLTGVPCPLNFVKAKLALEKIEIGEVLSVLLDEGEPVRNVPDSFAQQGQQVLEVENVGTCFCVTVRRIK